MKRLLILLSFLVLLPASVKAQQTSNSVPLTITGVVVTPTESKISPTSVSASTAFTLTVTGTGFQNNSVINAGSVALTTTFVSSTVLTAAIPATQFTSAQTVNITVVNPPVIVAHQSSLKWGASATGGVGYSAYRGSVSGGPIPS